MSSPAPAGRRFARSRHFPLFLLLTGAVIYGLAYSLFKMGTTAGIPFIPFVFWQTTGAALALWLISLLRRRPPKIDWPHVRLYLLLGILGFAIPGAIFAFVAPKIPAGVLSLAVTLEAGLTYLFALTLVMERFNWVRLTGLLFGLAGVLLIVLPEASLPSRTMVIWVLICFGTPFLFAVQDVLTERLWPADGTSLQISSGVLAAASLFMLPVMAATDSWWFFEGPMDSGDWALIGLIAINAVGVWMFLEMIRLAGAVFAATVTYLETLSGVAWGMVIFNEHHSAWIWAALALLLAGTFFINRTGRHHVTRHHGTP